MLEFLPVLNDLLGKEPFKKLLDAGTVKSLIDRMDKDTIYVLCLTVLAYGEPAEIKIKALEIIGQMRSAKP